MEEYGDWKITLDFRTTAKHCGAKTAVHNSPRTPRSFAKSVSPNVTGNDGEGVSSNRGTEKSKSSVKTSLDSTYCILSHLSCDRQSLGEHSKSREIKKPQTKNHNMKYKCIFG